MANDDKSPQMDLESAFSEEEKTEIRSYIDTIAMENRIAPEQATFDRRSARPGYLIPLLINVGAVVMILVGVLVLRSAFAREEADVRATSLEYSSIEGRLIRELRAESQQLIVAKEQEIEAVREQLALLEQEQSTLEADIEARLAAREAELREQLQAEITAERARLITDGIQDAELEDLLQAFEAERRAFYDQQLAEYRAELEQERIALQEEIDALRAEYQNRLDELQNERQQIVDEFRLREENLRVQLEQRTRVLEIARVEAGADLEAAQRELAALERAREDAQTVQDQVIGQIEAIQQAIVAGNDQQALARIDALTSYLSQDEVLQIQGTARRREMDLFLLRQLRALVEERLTAAGENRSITQELRFLSQIRTLSETAAGAPSDEAARQAFASLLDTLPEVAQAHDVVVSQARNDAIEEVRTAERQLLDETTASAATLSARGAYDEAVDVYVAALQALPSVAPEADELLAEILRLGYAMTDYVVDGESTAQVQEVARRANVDLEGERREFERRVNEAIRSAVGQEDAGLGVDIARRNDRIAELQDEVAQLEARLAAVQSPDADTSGVSREQLVRQVRLLQQQRNDLEDERQSLEDQRNQLVNERAALRARYVEYAAAQEEAIENGDFVALANARDAFFISPEVDGILEGLGNLLDEYDQQVSVEQQRTGLDVRDVTEIVEELSSGLNAAQRQALLDNAIETARSDQDPAMVDFLSLLQELVSTVASEG